LRALAFVIAERPVGSITWRFLAVSRRKHPGTTVCASSEGCPRCCGHARAANFAEHTIRLLGQAGHDLVYRTLPLVEPRVPVGRRHGVVAVAVVCTRDMERVLARGVVVGE